MRFLKTIVIATFLVGSCKRGADSKIKTSPNPNQSPVEINENQGAEVLCEELDSRFPKRSLRSECLMFLASNTDRPSDNEEVLKYATCLNAHSFTAMENPHTISHGCFKILLDSLEFEAQAEEDVKKTFCEKYPGHLFGCMSFAKNEKISTSVDYICSQIDREEMQGKNLGMSRSKCFANAFTHFAMEMSRE